VRPDPADIYVAEPEEPCGTGVLVVAGSSGRTDTARADLLAAHGARALALRWLGGVGPRTLPHEVPLETFVGALDLLAPDCDRMAMIGTSFGAEATLLTGSLDPRLCAVVGFSPSSVVWPGFADGRWSSHWTRDGASLPFVPFDEEWTPGADPPAYSGLYEASLPGPTEAIIPVERIAGDVVLVSGGDDRVWPSTAFAAQIAERRRAHGLDTTVVDHPAAGHRTVLPGEEVVVAGQSMARGGTPEADAELGRMAWPEIVRALRLTT
jgi:dienelactone hydrolase